jgi:hypothetical protein
MSYRMLKKLRDQKPMRNRYLVKGNPVVVRDEDRLRPGIVRGATKDVVIVEVKRKDGTRRLQQVLPKDVNERCWR